MTPIFRSYLSMTIELVYNPWMSGSSESSTLLMTTGELTLSKNGTTPATPWSNSWFPMVYKEFINSVHALSHTNRIINPHHRVSWLQVQEITGSIPSEQVVPQCALEIVACVQVNRIQIRFGLLQFPNLCHDPSISTDADIAIVGFAGAGLCIRLLEPAFTTSSPLHQVGLAQLNLIITGRGNRSGG